MSATGLDVFDKTLQTTNIWLDPHQIEKVRQTLPETFAPYGRPEQKADASNPPLETGCQRIQLR
jgi:hypothetical protein